MEGTLTEEAMSDVDHLMLISEAGIKRRLQKWGTESSSVLLVKADHGDDDPVATVTSAVVQANDVLRDAHRPSVQGDHVFLAASGAMLFLVSDEWNDDVRQWLEILRGALERQGWRGTVLAPSLSWYPEKAWSFRDSHSPWVGHLAMTQNQRTTNTFGRGWLVNEETTRKATALAVKWVSTISGTSYFSSGTAQIKIGPKPPPAELMVAALARCDQARVSMLGLKPLTERAVNVVSGSQIEFRAKGIEEHWRVSIQAVREPLLALGHAADYGAVSHPVDYHVQSAGGSRGLAGLSWRENRHLWSDYVPEVFGIQVLTESHLARSSDLGDWNVSPVGDHRYLVEAKDLEPWYSAPEPDPDARDRAREDFGDVLLTDASIRADPNGWIPGDPARRTFLT